MSEPVSSVREVPESRELPALHVLVRRVRRRLLADRLLRALALDLALGAAVAAVLVLADRLFALALPLGAVAGACAGVAALTAVARGLLLHRPRPAEAARALDERLELRERVSTALWLEDDAARHPGDPRRSAWTELVARDGLARLESVDLPRAFPLRIPRAAVAVPALAVLALLLGVLVPPLDLLGLGAERAALAAERDAVEEELEELDRGLEGLEEEADRADLSELESLLGKLREPGGPETREKRAGDREAASREAPAEARKQALVDLARREDRLRDASRSPSLEAFRKAMETVRKASLRDFELTRRLRQALEEGDFRRAERELEALGQDMERLARRGSGEEASESAKKELADARRQLGEELSRLAADTGALQSLSKTLQDAASSLDAGALPGALEGLKSAAGETAELDSLARQRDLLRQALQLVRTAKQDLAGTPQLGQLGDPASQPQGLPRPGKTGKPGTCSKCGRPKQGANPWTGAKASGTCPGGGKCSGGKKSAGLAGGKSSGASQAAGGRRSSQGGRTGPSGGRAEGQRAPGTPEDVGFVRDPVRGRIQGGGRSIGSLPAGGVTVEGEASVPTGGAVEDAVRELAQELEKEPLPVERRQLVERFQDLVLESRPAPEASEASEASEDGEAREP